MLKSLFLTYANNPFRDDPDNVFKIYKEIVAALPPDDHFSRKGIGDFIFSLVSLFAKAGNTENALKQLKILASRVGKDAMMVIEGWPEMTFSAVYWYRDSKSNCGERVCFRNLKNLDNVLKLNNFDSSIRLKCHECYQFAFIGVLKQ